jgi:hypothetical protein
MTEWLKGLLTKERQNVRGWRIINEGSAICIPGDKDCGVI